jgi:uncharacterized membrane protein
LLALCEIPIIGRLKKWLVWSVRGSAAMVRVDESSTASGKQWTWMLRRNCALTPRQVGRVYLSLVAASVLVAGFCAFRGAWMVVPFSVIEMSAVGVALLIYARHAVDCERVSLRADALLIEAVDGNRRSVTRLDRRAVRVVIEARPRLEVSVVSRGERVAVGRFIGERERSRFARELRQALSLAA